MVCRGHGNERLCCPRVLFSIFCVDHREHFRSDSDQELWWRASILVRSISSHHRPLELQHLSHSSSADGCGRRRLQTFFSGDREQPRSDVFCHAKRGCDYFAARGTVLSLLGKTEHCLGQTGAEKALTTLE